MALSNCTVNTDKTKKEMTLHGIPMFPIACYEDDLNKMNVVWHWHDEFEFIIATEGTVHVHIDNQMISLESGEAVFINSEVLHSIDIEKDRPCICHSLVFHARLIGGSVESIFWQRLISPLLQNKTFHFIHLNPSVSWQEELINNMASAWQVIATETNDFENTARFHITKAFGILNDHQQFLELCPNVQEHINAERTKKIMQYIEDNYQKELTLDMIAQSASISKSACLRCFRKAINTTPIRYLMQYRIEKATDALQKTNEKVNVIAINCGFSDISYFSKCFREIMGCTPIAYRNSKMLDSI